MEVALDIEIYFSHPHVHSKLRNGTTKGGRGNSRTSNTIEKNNSSSSISSGNGGSTPSTSPTAFLPPRPEKRKSKDEPSSPTNVDNDASSPSMVNASGIPISLSAGGLVTQPQSLINPVTGLNVQISTKKCKTSSPCAVSPVLLECPEQDCSKKYKHANGLRYHQSHAHGNGALLDDDCMVEVDEPPITPLNSPVSLPPTSVVSEVVTAAEPLKVSEFSALKISDQSEMCSALSEVQGISLPFVHLENSEETESYVDSIEHTPADSQSNSSKVVPTSNISLEPSRQGQNSQISSSDSSNINNLSPLEQSNVDHTAPGKTGVLRFGQAESKINNVSLLSVQAESKSNCNDHDPLLPESSSPVSDPHTARSLSKDGNKTQQKPNSDSYNISGDTCTQNCRDEGDIQGANKVPPSMSCGSKQKKNRKSPMPNELEVDRFNACNVSSREDVQSPAYSDISDDSTPVNDQQLLERNQPSKNPDLNKKSTDVVLPSGSGCTTSVQTTMPSPLGGYGVYQFYQQQQFLIQPPIEQHQSNKSNTNTITQSPTALSGTPQQPSNLTEFNRKDPALDLISKSSAPTIQVLSPSSHEISKDIPQANISSSQGARGLALAPGALSSSTPSKSVSHFYAFNYMSPGYPFNVDQNYAPVPITADDGKLNRHSGILSPTDLQQSTVLFKDDRGKELNIPNETVKALQQQQISSNKPIKSELIPKSENIKTDSVSTISSQVSHHPLHTKDLQGMGVYTNMYQRHPMTLTSHQLSREEELRRYYIFSEQQRRQNSTVTNINLINQQSHGCSTQPSHQQCKDDPLSGQENSQTQHQVKLKSNTSLSMVGNGGKPTTVAKESPKQKPEDEIKIIKQEGQKPTMETQGPPPPPTSQYFLHPSYIAPTPFGFDPNHPMYRNVLIPPTAQYNTTPYHLPMPRYHAPEDLSRNTGTKALDVLHHAASQYYTTHKIHELSERALKSPNSGNNNGANAIKVSVSSSTIGTTQHSTISANSVGHHSSITQPTSSTQQSHNLTSQTIAAASNKQEISGQKTHGSGSGVQGAAQNDIPKSQSSSNSPIVSHSSVGNTNTSVGADSRSPPPQRHVHTHHHTHVGLGYPMYPAPYGAAVLASQQAAAVAVINPFPPGPTK